MNNTGKMTCKSPFIPRGPAAVRCITPVPGSLLISVVHGFSHVVKSSGQLALAAATESQHAGQPGRGEAGPFVLG